MRIVPVPVRDAELPLRGAFDPAERTLRIRREFRRHLPRLPYRLLDHRRLDLVQAGNQILGLGLVVGNAQAVA